MDSESSVGRPAPGHVKSHSCLILCHVCRDHSSVPSQSPCPSRVRGCRPPWGEAWGAGLPSLSAPGDGWGRASTLRPPEFRFPSLSLRVPTRDTRSVELRPGQEGAPIPVSHVCVYETNLGSHAIYCSVFVLFFIVSAVYDCTLNFRNNENPTLLGVLNGKKYHADMYVR